MNANLIQSDLIEYRSANLAYDELYAKIGTNESLARLMRSERSAVTRRRREAAENLAMCMVGHYSPKLAAAGLLDFYKSISAGAESDTVTFRVAEETVKFLSA